MRGKRKCGTCACFEPLPEEFKSASCTLKVCECRRKGETFGIALCANYVPRRFLDTSGARAEGGVNGHCMWEPPPVMRGLLWGSRSNTQRNSETSWCHCWVPAVEVKEVQLGELSAGKPFLIEGSKDGN